MASGRIGQLVFEIIQIEYGLMCRIMIQFSSYSGYVSQRKDTATKASLTVFEKNLRPCKFRLQQLQLLQCSPVFPLSVVAR